MFDTVLWPLSSLALVVALTACGYRSNSVGTGADASMDADASDATLPDVGPRDSAPPPDAAPSTDTGPTDTGPTDAQVCEACVLDVQLPRFAAAGATDCGELVHPFLGPGDVPAEVHACVASELAGGSDFTVRQQFLGAEATIANGWLGIGGRVFVLAHDPAPCGDAGIDCGGRCGPRVGMLECVGPTMVDLAELELAHTDGYNLPLMECADYVDGRVVCGSP